MSEDVKLVQADGMLLRYVNGQLRRATPKKTGTMRGWYSNGQLEIEMPMTNGIAHGAVREWYSNGALRREYNYCNGKLDGIWRQWSTDGSILGEFEMRNGLGYIKNWGDDGCLESESEVFSDSLIRGVIWDELGRPHERFTENGRSISRKKFLEKIKSLSGS